MDPVTGDVIDINTGQVSDDTWQSLPEDVGSTPDGNGEPEGSPL